jgi:hypothetical protein
MHARWRAGNAVLVDDGGKDDEEAASLGSASSIPGTTSVTDDPR